MSKTQTFLPFLARIKAGAPLPDKTLTKEILTVEDFFKESDLFSCKRGDFNSLYCFLPKSSLAPVTICDKIIMEGVQNCLFLIEREGESIPMRVCEDRYKLEGEYKITLREINEGGRYDHFYTSDLTSLIREGKIQFLIRETV